MAILDRLLGRKPVSPAIEDVLRRRLCGPYDRKFAENFAFDKDHRAHGEWTPDLCVWSRTMRASFIIYEMTHISDARRDDPFDNYNNFSIDKVCHWLKKYKDTVHFLPAREYSVALYLSGPISTLREIQGKAREIEADEAHLRDRDGRTILRLWWD